MKKAYSYHRVSTESQAASGDGLQRQRENAITFLKSHPEYVLHDEINDAGVSAYKGHNLLSDAGLGRFIASVEAGEVPEDSLLILENADRLSRQGIRKGQTIIQMLFDYKINIGLVKFNLILKHNDENDISGAMLVAAALYLGRLESEQKSKRIKEVFQIKRNNAVAGGQKLKLARRPWLKLSDDAMHYNLIPDRIAIVKRMFDLKISGMGVMKIVDTFNHEGLPTEGFAKTRWNTTLISNTIKSKTVLGEYHPRTVEYIDGVEKRQYTGEPILDYYPQIIDEDIFNSANATFKKTVVGRTGSYQHLFRGIMKCGHCGYSMSYKNNGKSKYTGVKYPDKVYCNGRKSRSTDCTLQYQDYKKFEGYILGMLKFLDFSNIVNPDDNSHQVTILQTQRIELEAKIKNYAISIGELKDSSTLPMILGMLKNSEVELTACKVQISELLASKISVDDSILKLDLSIDDNRRLVNTYLIKFVSKLEVTEETIEIGFHNVSSSIKVTFDDDGMTEENLKDCVLAYEMLHAGKFERKKKRVK